MASLMNSIKHVKKKEYNSVYTLPKKKKMKTTEFFPTHSVRPVPEADNDI